MSGCAEKVMEEASDSTRPTASVLRPPPHPDTRVPAAGSRKRNPQRDVMPSSGRLPARAVPPRKHSAPAAETDPQSSRRRRRQISLTRSPGCPPVRPGRVEAQVSQQRREAGADAAMSRPTVFGMPADSRTLRRWNRWLFACSSRPRRRSASLTCTPRARPRRPRPGGGDDAAVLEREDVERAQELFLRQDERRSAPAFRQTVVRGAHAGIGKGEAFDECQRVHSIAVVIAAVGHDDCRRVPKIRCEIRGQRLQRQHASLIIMRRLCCACRSVTIRIQLTICAPPSAIGCHQCAVSMSGVSGAARASPACSADSKRTPGSRCTPSSPCSTAAAAPVSSATSSVCCRPATC